MTTITTEAIQHAYDAVIERLEIAGEIANTNREIAYLFTAARFAVEASQRLDTLQAELAACQQLAQRLVTDEAKVLQQRADVIRVEAMTGDVISVELDEMIVEETTLTTADQARDFAAAILRAAELWEAAGDGSE